MVVKTINSTEAQNNFGRLLDDVAEKGTQYLIQRFGKVKAVVIPLGDFRRLVGQNDQAIRLLRESGPEYSLGQTQTEEAVQHLIEPASKDQ
jgi:prevent-host-death family protein